MIQMRHRSPNNGGPAAPRMTSSVPPQVQSDPWSHTVRSPSFAEDPALSPVGGCGWKLSWAFVRTFVGSLTGLWQFFMRSVWGPQAHPPSRGPQQNGTGITTMFSHLELKTLTLLAKPVRPTDAKRYQVGFVTIVAFLTDFKIKDRL